MSPVENRSAEAEKMKKKTKQIKEWDETGGGRRIGLDAKE